MTCLSGGYIGLGTVTFQTSFPAARNVALDSLACDLVCTELYQRPVASLSPSALPQNTASPRKMTHPALKEAVFPIRGHGPGTAIARRTGSIFEILTGRHPNDAPHHRWASVPGAGNKNTSEHEVPRRAMVTSH